MTKVWCRHPPSQGPGTGVVSYAMGAYIALNGRDSRINLREGSFDWKKFKGQITKTSDDTTLQGPGVGAVSYALRAYMVIMEAMLVYLQRGLI